MGNVSDDFKKFNFIQKHFAQKVKDLRERKELTQEELAKIVGIDRSSLANIERGVHIPSLEVAGKLAGALDTTCDYLLSERTEKTKEDLEKEPFAQFVLRSSQYLTSDEKEKIQQIIKAWRENRKKE